MKEDRTRVIDLLIARVLQVGVAVSAVLVVVGLILFLVTGNSGYPGTSFPQRLPAIFSGLAAGKPYAIMLLGLMVLILTPVLRVGFSIFLFLKEKDRAYVGITALVFLILIVSFFLGKAGG